MQPQHLNVILFQDSQQSIKPNMKNTNASRSLNELFSQLNEIQKKITKIQIQEQSIQEKVRLLSDNHKENDMNGRNIEEVLMFLEQKLQTLIRESQQAIEQIKQEVERALTKEILNRKMKKFESNEQISKIQKAYQQKLKYAQETFNSELNNIASKNKTIQQAFESRMQTLQQRFSVKIKEMTSNQKLLKDKIKQQQQQIRKLNESLKSKVEKSNNTVTAKHTEPQRAEPIKISRPQLAEVKALKNPTKQNAIDEDKDNHSRIRRNRIFNKNKERHEQNSVSPIKTVYSDLNSMKIFNKDLDRFEDFKEHDLDGSDEDVFFYPQSNKQKNSSVPILAALDMPVVNGFKESNHIAPVAFSPFDVN